MLPPAVYNEIREFIHKIALYSPNVHRTNFGVKVPLQLPLAYVTQSVLDHAAAAEAIIAGQVLPPLQDAIAPLGPAYRSDDKVPTQCFFGCETTSGRAHGKSRWRKLPKCWRQAKQITGSYAVQNDPLLALLADDVNLRGGCYSTILCKLNRRIALDKKQNSGGRASSGIT